MEWFNGERLTFNEAGAMEKFNKERNPKDVSVKH